jgi:hypothetical protein
MLIRTSIDETGRYLPRRVDTRDAFIAVSQLTAHEPENRAALPGGLESLFDKLMAEARALYAPLEALLPPDEDVPKLVPEPDPALLALAGRDVLDSPRALNNFIDSAARAFGMRVRGAAEGPVPNEDSAAGTFLEAAIFPDGRGFLNLSNQHQWAAVHSRFPEPTSAVRQHLARLGLTEAYQQVRSLNAHFGRLLGITASQYQANVQPNDNPMADFLNLAVRLVCFANLAWPTDSATDIEHRAYFAEPYLGIVRRDALAYAKRQRDGKSDLETTEDGVAEPTVTTEVTEPLP